MSSSITSRAIRIAARPIIPPKSTLLRNLASGLSEGPGMTRPAEETRNVEDMDRLLEVIRASTNQHVILSTSYFFDILRRAVEPRLPVVSENCTPIAYNEQLKAVVQLDASSGSSPLGRNYGKQPGRGGEIALASSQRSSRPSTSAHAPFVLSGDPIVSTLNANPEHSCKVHPSIQIRSQGVRTVHQRSWRYTNWVRVLS